MTDIEKPIQTSDKAETEVSTERVLQDLPIISMSEAEYASFKDADFDSPEVQAFIEANGLERDQDIIILIEGPEGREPFVALTSEIDFFTTDRIATAELAAKSAVDLSAESDVAPEVEALDSVEANEVEPGAEQELIPRAQIEQDMAREAVETVGIVSPGALLGARLDERLGVRPESTTAQVAPEKEAENSELLTPAELEEAVGLAQRIINTTTGIRQNNPNQLRAAYDIQVKIADEVARVTERYANGDSSKLTTALASAMAIGASTDRGYANKAPAELLASLGMLSTGEQETLQRYSKAIDDVVNEGRGDRQKLDIIASLKDKIQKMEQDPNSSVESSLILNALIMGFGTQLNNRDDSYRITYSYTKQLHRPAGKQ